MGSDVVTSFTVSMLVFLIVIGVSSYVMAIDTFTEDKLFTGVPPLEVFDEARNRINQILTQRSIYDSFSLEVDVPWSPPERRDVKAFYFRLHTLKRHFRDLVRENLEFEGESAVLTLELTYRFNLDFKPPDILYRVVTGENLPEALRGVIATYSCQLGTGVLVAAVTLSKPPKGALSMEYYPFEINDKNAERNC